METTKQNKISNGRGIKGIKFAQKRLKANESELEYYEGLFKVEHGDKANK